MLSGYDVLVGRSLRRPWTVLGVFAIIFVASLTLFPRLGLAFFPRTDAGQFVINLKAPSGTRLAVTESEVAKVEKLVRETVSPEDLQMVVSNIGTVPDFSAIYTTNSADAHRVRAGEPQGRTQNGQLRIHGAVQRKLAAEMPELATYFQSGGLVDAVLNLGLPAPIDVQVAGTNLRKSYDLAAELAAKIRRLPGVSDAYIPQDIDYPALQLDIDRDAGQRVGAESKGSSGQRDHGADVESDDRAQLLGGSEDRQRLHADGAISGAAGAEPGGFEVHPIALGGPCDSGAAGRGEPDHAHPVADRSGSLPIAPGDRCICQAVRRGFGQDCECDRWDHRGDQGSGRFDR